MANKVWRFLALDKLAKAFEIFRQNGGILGTMEISYRTDTAKDGRLVGVDEFGNKYFENQRYFMPRSRWIVYPRSVWLDYDPSQVPPRWHRWLHFMCDEPPTEYAPKDREWMLPHEQNFSGTNAKYVPYSTTRAKIEAWEPSHLKKQ